MTKTEDEIMNSGETLAENAALEWAITGAKMYASQLSMTQIENGSCSSLKLNTKMKENDPLEASIFGAGNEALELTTTKIKNYEDGNKTVAEKDAPESSITQSQNDALILSLLQSDDHEWSEIETNRPSCKSGI